ncbi:Prenyltransferase OS=Streptomyces antimycoticus OX=68175 GN=SANT12839_068410 PE=4 SV=1 [Streptomyces antimycoticus]
MERSASLPSSPSLPTPRARRAALPSAESSALSRAERFVWLTARVLEQRRFAYHFLGGGAEAVETALAAYLGTDGGYGHALEPDLRGPASQPLHAVHALRVLDGIGRCGGQRAERLCRYLTSVSDPGRRAARLPPLAARLSGGPLGPGGGRCAR